MSAIIHPPTWTRTAAVLPTPPAAAPDQASQLRRLAGQRTAGASVIAITSGKGGVGKSNIAVNLAVRLAAMDLRVVLLDADLGLANADVLCNVDLPSNLSHVISRRREFSEVMVNAPGGFHLIGGASGLADMADLPEEDRQRLVGALNELEARTDVILIDTGAGISPNVLSFTRCADQVLVVTTPEPTAITDAYAVVKVISRENRHRSLSLLVNQVSQPEEGQAVYQRIAQVARQFLSVHVLNAGCVMCDPRVPAAVRGRMPFMLSHPRCPASLCIGQLAARLTIGIAPTGLAANGGPPTGFFQRMGKWFRK